MSTSSKPPRGTGRGPRAHSSGSGRQAVVILQTDVAEPAWDWAGEVPVPYPFNTGKLVLFYILLHCFYGCVL